MSKKHLAKAAIAAVLLTASVEGAVTGNETSTLLAVAACGGGGQQQGGTYYTPNNGTYSTNPSNPYDSRNSAGNYQTNQGWNQNPNNQNYPNNSYPSNPTSSNWDNNNYNRR